MKFLASSLVGKIELLNEPKYVGEKVVMSLNSADGVVFVLFEAVLVSIDAPGTDPLTMQRVNILEWQISFDTESDKIEL